VAKAPFNMKVTGVFYRQQDNTVYTDKNFMIGQQREKYRKEEGRRRLKEIHETLKRRLKEERIEAGLLEAEAELSPEEQQKREWEMEQQAEVDRSLVTSLGDRLGPERLGPVTTTPMARNPIYMNIYGKTNHQVLSYSIQNGRMSGTHVFISDASSYDKIEEQMFALEGSGGGHPHPSGRVSIWEPTHRQVDASAAITELNEEVNSTFKIYCPPHLLEAPSYVRANFLVPTLMDKIYLEAERQGSLEMDGGLMDQSEAVAMASDCGRIKAKDIWSEKIRLASRQGDIYCDGLTEGEVVAETRGDGDFTARSVVGPLLRVDTDSGDIHVVDECFSEVVEIYTVTGQVRVRKHFGKAKILIKEEGDLYYGSGDGSFDIVVKKGEVTLRLEEVLEDSHVEVESGKVAVKLVRRQPREGQQEGDPLPLRFHIESPKISIPDSRIFNSGELTVLENGSESFVSASIPSEEGAEERPLLTIRCHHGQVSLQETPPPEKLPEGMEDWSDDEFEDWEDDYQ